MPQAFHLPLEAVIELEAYGQSIAFQIRDFAEGITRKTDVD